MMPGRWSMDGEVCRWGACAGVNMAASTDVTVQAERSEGTGNFIDEVAPKQGEYNWGGQKIKKIE